MALRLLVTITACLLVSATASAARQLVITERDSGKTFTVRRGGQLTLRLSSSYRWTGPKVKGRAIRLVPVDYFVDPGFREWEIHAVALGRTRITATGVDQSCSATPCAQRRFRVVVAVRPRRS
jgi:predicted secreted protein